MPPASKTQQLIDYLRGEIDAGRLRPGDRIPTAKDLMAQRKVSITVYRDAVNHLKATGYLVGVPGVGVYVTDNPPEGGSVTP